VRGLGPASDTGISAVREARSTVGQLRALGTASTEPMRNLRFVLEDVNDRSRAVEPNRLSPTGGGFTGLEAVLQYFFTQSQAINIYDSKGFMLKLSLLVNECSQYTNAATAIANPARTARCKQWLGPNQTGINAGAMARMTPHKPTSSSPKARKTPPAEAPTPQAPAAQAPAPEAPAPAAPPPPPPPPPSLLPDAKNLLDKLLPKVGGLLPKRSARSTAPSDASARNLLDYLLGP
jgi:hypothetical protein